MIRFDDSIQMVPHAGAPLVELVNHDQLFVEAVKAVTSEPSTWNEEDLSLIRQVALGNLFFFLKYIAGYSGPYSQLKADLHMEMCNWRQKALEPGTWSAGFVPRSTYKSQCVGETVMTQRGPVLVESLTVGDSLLQLDANGHIRTCHIKALARDKAECLEITTTMGRILRIADHHGYKTPSGWKRASDLEVGEALQLAVRTVPIVQGTVDDWCAGAVWGDGGLTGDMVKLTSADAEIHELFSSVHPYTKGKNGKYTKAIKGGRAWWKSLGLPFCLAIHKDYPLRYEGNAAFLRGLFDTDGFFQSQGSGVGFCSASKKLAQGVQRNLLHFGILSAMTEVETLEGRGRGYYVLAYGRLGLENFARYIGFVCKHKAQKLKKALEADKGYGTVYETVPTCVWKKWIAKGQNTRELKKKVRIDNNYWMTVRKVRKLDELLGHNAPSEQLKKDYWWDFVKARESIGVFDVVHIEIEETPEYVDGQGLVCHNSSVWTHGAPAWELVRNPDLRIGIFSCIQERSLEFMHTLQRTFDNNEMMAVLFPDHCTPRVRTKDGRWNDVLGIMPNRSRNFPEPSIKAHTAGGSTQGVHVDLAVFDDVVGDSQLNSARQATAEMERIGNWFSSSLRTLLISQATSRVTLAATRYSVDDPYEVIMADARTHDGDWSALETYYPPPGSRGRWRVYYRSALADGESIFPESYSVEFLQRLAKDDPWTYTTQYVNNPHNTGTLDFASYSLRKAKLEYVDEEPMLLLQKGGQWEEVLLSECDLVEGVDPGASSKRISTKTSRSAQALVARTPRDDVVILDCRKDYVKPSKLFDWVFNLHRKYRGAIRQVRLEGQGPFKLLADVLKDEMKRRGEHFYLLSVPAMGDKIPSIKMQLEPFLKRDALFVIEESERLIKSEFDIFPSSQLDLLDAVKIAVAGTRLPEGAWAEDEDDDDEDHAHGFAGRHVGAAGY